MITALGFTKRVLAFVKFAWLAYRKARSLKKYQSLLCHIYPINYWLGCSKTEITIKSALYI